jgi:D123
MFFTQALRQTFPEHYPDGLRDLMMPMVSIKLSAEDAVVLGGFNMAFRAAMTGGGSDSYFSDGFLDTLDAAMAQFPEGVMPRLGYCSWKAGSVDNIPAIGTRGVLQVMSRDDPRIGRAMIAHVVMNEPAVLHLRPWIKIPEWAEFRMFIRGGRVVGASQYLHRAVFPAITHNEAAILAALQQFSTVLLPALHLDDVVADVFVTPQGTGFRTTLIELNPFQPETDACLFSWARGGNFDGSFRFHRLARPADRPVTAAAGGAGALSPPPQDDYWTSGR